MVQKVILFLILAALAVVVFMVSKVQRTVEGIRQNPSGGDFANVQTPAPNSVDLTPGSSLKIPPIWENLKDSGTLRVFLSYDTVDYPQAKEFAEMLEKTANLSVFLPNHTSDKENIDDESKNAMMFMDCFIVFFSPAYARGQVSNQEYGFASAITAFKAVISTETELNAAKAYAGDALVLTLTSENASTIGAELTTILRAKQAGLVGGVIEQKPMADPLIFE